MVGMFQTIERSSKEVVEKLQSDELKTFVQQRQLLIAQLKFREQFLISRQPNRFKRYSDEERLMFSSEIKM
jgi:hypothetical protein